MKANLEELQGQHDSKVEENSMLQQRLEESEGELRKNLEEWVLAQEPVPFLGSCIRGSKNLFVRLLRPSFPNTTIGASDPSFSPSYPCKIVKLVTHGDW